MLEKAQQRDQDSRAFERDIKSFGEILLQEPALLEKLDATPNKTAFMDLYCSLAKERGLHFSHANLLIAIQEQKQGQDWIIPKPVLRMIVERF
jgi:hypothetical protein